MTNPKLARALLPALGLLAGLASAWTNPWVLDAVVASPPPGISYSVVKATHPRVQISANQPRTASHQRLQGIRGPHRANARSVAAVLGAHQRRVGGWGYENITSTTAYGTQYATWVTWFQTLVLLLLDTGSSDTWCVQSNYSCVDYARSKVSQSTCAFGPPYPGGFQYDSNSGDGGVGTDDVSDQHMYIQYGDGELVTGPMGYSDITLGGNLTVRKQEVCLANSTYWFGNNMTSGVLGLAFPALTNAYLGQSSSHAAANQIQYSPLFTSMVNQGLVPPLFSIAIDRNSSSGIIAWGGIPPVNGLDPDPSHVASCDMLIVKLNNNPTTEWQYSFYTIIPDGWRWGQTNNSDKFPFIVDSGTTLIYLPEDLAEAINAAFVPAAVYLELYGAYFTSCTATKPLVSVILDGILFTLNPNDLVYRDMVDPVTGMCMTAIASGGNGPYILGDVFLQNVVAVFDIGQAQMRFIPREFY